MPDYEGDRATELRGFVADVFGMTPDDIDKSDKGDKGDKDDRSSKGSK